jgi:hypothetical protein
MNAAVRVRFKNGGYRAHPLKGIAEFMPIGKQRSPAPNGYAMQLFDAFF